jgi:hypothetical protein
MQVLVNGVDVTHTLTVSSSGPEPVSTITFPDNYTLFNGDTITFTYPTTTSLPGRATLTSTASHSGTWTIVPIPTKPEPPFLPLSDRRIISRVIIESIVRGTA